MVTFATNTYQVIDHGPLNTYTSTYFQLVQDGYKGFLSGGEKFLKSFGYID